ncbi:MAG: M56 family metallopeptidase [Bacillota bacterium]|nr:M56 family metallopeptidase [Bacillota bacterium]MDW7684213.1 M56 family metallopeptidase [Bacillota bacterium]
MINLFFTALTLSLMGTVTAAGILLVKWLASARFSPKWHYFIWMLLVARLLIPVFPESSLSIFNLPVRQHEAGTAIEYQAGDKISFSAASQRDTSSGIIPRTKDLPDKYTPIDPGQTPDYVEFPRSFIHAWLARFWLAGFLLIAVYFLSLRILLHIKLHRIPPYKNNRFQALLYEAMSVTGYSNELVVFEFDGIATPSLFGIFRPRLLIPPRMMDRLEDRDIYHMLLHEFAHVKHRDPLIHTILHLVLSLHWFNPFIWLAIRRMKLDGELACDAYVLEHLHKDKGSYGETLLRVMDIAGNRNFASVTTCMAVYKSNLRRRIELVANRRTYTKTVSALTVIITILMSALFLTDAAAKPVPTVTVERALAIAGEIYGIDTVVRITRKTGEEIGISEEEAEDMFYAIIGTVGTWVTITVYVNTENVNQHTMRGSQMIGLPSCMDCHAMPANPLEMREFRQIYETDKINEIKERKLAEAQQIPIDFFTEEQEMNKIAKEEYGLSVFY